MVFHTYVKDGLVPTLRPADVVILDNLSAHKSKATAELIENVGARIEFLPAYSPDFNPIEKMWSKVKESLRATKARDYNNLIAAIRAALRKVTPEDAMNWFVSCGYSFN